MALRGDIGCVVFAGERKRDNDHAIADLTEAIRLQPQNSTLYAERGSNPAEKKDLARAIAVFRWQ